MDRAKLCERIIFPEHPGREMKLIREEKGLCQKDLAKSYGTTIQAICKTELRGKDMKISIVKRFTQTIPLSFPGIPAWSRQRTAF